jgi:hypothetical protein
MRLEGLVKLKKFSGLIGTRTRDLSTCRIAPQPSTLDTYIFFITPVYLQSVQNTISKWEKTETNGKEESSVALIHMEEAQGLEW